MATGQIEVDFGNWRDLITSEHGPSEHTTRGLLLVLSLYMNPRRNWCFPSQPTIAVRVGLSERAVREHLKLAKEARWIFIRHKPRSAGNRPAREYVATIPAELKHLVKDHLAKHRQPENGADSPSRQPAICAEQPANGAGDTGNLCQKHRHRLPPNSYSENAISIASEFRRGSERPCEQEKDRRHSRATLQTIREGIELRRSQGAPGEIA